ncbi:hypothetical protein AB3Y40_12535 [Yoonia sp. R2331]|uniref:hypothetical protein n=1 Tax=Yoonia sp. R2331 TaxID=3237238 RepID=UPI0034E4DA8E
MSDPVTNVEIEDVLSSIRRLVSEGEKPRREAAAAVDARSETPEKLVLTPAFRVDEPEKPEAAAELESPAADDFLVLTESTEVEEEDVADDPSPTDRADLEATIAELEAAVTEQPDEWEPDGSETDDYKPNWDRTLFEAVEEAAAEAATQEVGAGLAAAMDRPTHDVSTAGWFSRRAAAAKPDIQEQDAIAHDETPEEAEEDTADHWAEAAPTASNLVNEAETPVEVVADEAIAVSEPDVAETEEMGRVAFQHLDRALVTPSDDLIGSTHADPDTQADQPEDEALRQMVLEIVRQELNGKLGERITRNVRKLVRREIMRVLNAQDFD